MLLVKAPLLRPASPLSCCHCQWHATTSPHGCQATIHHHFQHNQYQQPQCITMDTTHTHTHLNGLPRHHVNTNAPNDDDKGCLRCVSSPGRLVHIFLSFFFTVLTLILWLDRPCVCPILNTSQHHYRHQHPHLTTILKLTGNAARDNKRHHSIIPHHL